MTTLDIFKKELNLLIDEMQRCTNTKIKEQILNDILLIHNAVKDQLRKLTEAEK
ncbi:hypothetical protein [Cytobacillus firmus]